MLVTKKDDKVILERSMFQVVIIYRAIRAGEDCILDQIVVLVHQAQNFKPKITRIVDKIPVIFVLMLFIITILQCHRLV